MTEDERRRYRTEQWWRSRCRNGHASVCPVCGRYTTSAAGMHRACGRKERRA